jgi:hypothetical protein
MLFKMVDLSRSSDIHRILFSSLTFNSEGMEGTRMPMKNSRLRDSRTFKCTRNVQNSKICVVDAWQQYVTRTQQQRRIGDKVFISFKDPTVELGVQRIAKETLWIMNKAGIDTNKYKAHSTRMAAASKALDIGFTVDDVMKQGRWRSREVFEKFYNRSKAKDFGSVLLEER